MWRVARKFLNEGAKWAKNLADAARWLSSSTRLSRMRSVTTYQEVEKEESQGQKTDGVFLERLTVNFLDGVDVDH